MKRVVSVLLQGVPTMSPLKRAFNQSAIVVTALSLGVVTAGCEVKDKDEKILVVGEATSSEQQTTEDPSPPSDPSVGGEPSSSESPKEGSPKKDSASTSEEGDPSAAQIKELVDLYGGNDGFTKEEIDNLLAKFGSDDSGSFDVTKIMGSDQNGDGKVTVSEIHSGVTDLIPTMKWIPKGGEATKEEINTGIFQMFPHASSVARKGLLHALMRFDQPFADGNGNGMLSRPESGMAGLVLGKLSEQDLSKGIEPWLPTATNNSYEGLIAHQLMVEEIHRKTDRQIFSRGYATPRFSDLPEVDKKVEIIQLALKALQIDDLLNGYGVYVGDASKNQSRRVIPQAKMVEALQAFGLGKLGDASRLEALLKFYDGALADGNKADAGDRQFDFLELFHLVTDVEYAWVMLANMKVNFDSFETTDQKTKGAFVGHLVQTFPRVGWDLFFENGTHDPSDAKVAGMRLRGYYWSRITTTFDSPAAGGNNDGSKDLAEFVTMVNAARLFEQAFLAFDMNNDHQIGRELECEPALQLIFEFKKDSAEESCDVIFGLRSFDPEKDKLWLGIQLISNGNLRKDYLTPYELYERVEPTLVNEVFRVKK